MFSIENKSIRFTWSAKMLTEEIINLSAIHAENTGSITFEQCVLTPDNDIFLNYEIRNAISDLVVVFIKYANIVDGSIITSLEDLLGLAIKQTCDSNGNIVVNPSRLAIIDMKCHQYIVNSVLLRWAKGNNLKDIADKFTELQFSANNDIKTNLFHLRVLAYSKSYTFISEA